MSIYWWTMVNRLFKFGVFWHSSPGKVHIIAGGLSNLHNDLLGRTHRFNPSAVLTCTVAESEWIEETWPKCNRSWGWPSTKLGLDATHSLFNASKLPSHFAISWWRPNLDVVNTNIYRSCLSKLGYLRCMKSHMISRMIHHAGTCP